PAGFADRVLAARRAPAPRRPRWVLATLAAGLAAALVAALWHRGGIEKGTVAVLERTEIPLGRGAVAGAEPGAALAWGVDDGAARIEQTRGDVFYRVERGGPFVVATPAGTVTVKGTCFRVEVTEMKQAVIGAAVGAAAMAAVLVTVYEGRVLLANEHGATEVRAGEKARAQAGETPAAVAR